MWPAAGVEDCRLIASKLPLNFRTVPDNRGMDEDTFQHEPLPLNKAARYLCVPARWLRDEIEAGRLPGLCAERTILVHVPTVAKLLAERAKIGEGMDRE